MFKTQYRIISTPMQPIHWVKRKGSVVHQVFYKDEASSFCLHHCVFTGSHPPTQIQIFKRYYHHNHNTYSPIHHSSLSGVPLIGLKPPSVISKSCFTRHLHHSYSVFQEPKCLISFYKPHLFSFLVKR